MKKGDVVWLWWNVGKTSGRKVIFEKSFFLFGVEHIDFRFDKNSDFVLSTTYIGTSWDKISGIEYGTETEEPEFDLIENREKQFKLFE